MIENKYVALRIYNNFDWRAALQALENNNYTWSSGDKPTSLYSYCTQGTIYINPISKTLTKSSINTLSKRCNYYITMK